MKKILFIDRDGVLINEPNEDKQVDSIDKFSFMPGAISALSDLSRQGYEFVMVTNQDGLGTPSFPEEQFWPLQNLLMRTLEGEGVVFSAVHIDPSFEHEKKDTRKPGIGMLKKYFTSEYDLTGSYVIGDRETDMQLSKNLGAKAIFFGTDHPTAELATTSWDTISRFLTFKRQAIVTRETNETAITVSINLDGGGKSTVKTGLGFFDHMLDQVAYHGMFDLEITCKGDLHIDEHHTIEDTALALGEAVRKALGAKAGIYRYGFVLPMDESLATVSIDFSGRPWLVWNASFQREKIGEMPTEMFMHFFKSFSDASGATLNIEATGTNEHHKIEAIFKGFGRAMRWAVSMDPKRDEVPSTKGIL